MNLFKWDTLLFETYPANVFIRFQQKSSFLADVRDNKTNEPDNEDEYVKECDGEEEKGEITLSKVLKMADRREMYRLRKGIPDAHPKS